MNAATIIDTAPALDTRQAAAYLGFAPYTLKAWRIHGKGPKFSRIGDGRRPAVRYALADLRDFVGAR